MDPPVGSDSSGGKRKAKPRKLASRLIPLRLEDTPKDLAVVVLTMDKPSDVPNAPKWEREVCLDMTDPNDKFSLSIMMKIHHPNVLHLESVLSGDSVNLCVERYTVSLFNRVYKLRGVAGDVEKVRDLLRQVAEGLEELRLHNLYHGNLKIDTTYYDASTALVKLANFKERDYQNLTEAQLGDWHQFGNMLEVISNINRSRFWKTVNCYLLDDLANELKQLTPLKALSQVKESTLNHVYFWNRNRRSSFYTYDIVEALCNPDFVKEVKKPERLNFIADNWHKGQGKLLDLMNRYRIKKGGGGGGGAVGIQRRTAPVCDVC
ncbi:unnamed protein product [Urochloa humidicola]